MRLLALLSSFSKDRNERFSALTLTSEIPNPSYTAYQKLEKGTPFGRSFPAWATIVEYWPPHPPPPRGYDRRLERPSDLPWFNPWLLKQPPGKSAQGGKRLLLKEDFKTKTYTVPNPVVYMYSK